METSETETNFESKYRLGVRIGSGAFCDVYSGVYKPNNNEVAIKLNRYDGYFLVKNEYERMTDIVSQFTPTPLDFGRNPSFIVLSLEGPSIVMVALAQTNQKFSLNQCLYVMFHCFNALNYLVRCGFCHGDTHMGNFVMSKTPGKAPILVIDFAGGKEATPSRVSLDVIMFLEYLQPHTEYHPTLFDNLREMSRIGNDNGLELYDQMLNFIKQQGFEENAPSPI